MTTDIPDSDPPPDYTSNSAKELKEEVRSGSSGKPEQRYIYYRVYAPDGAIPSKSAFDPADPYVGRILARSVPPPHNVSSLKRCFVGAERLEDPTGTRTTLYRSTGNAAPCAMAEKDKVEIRGTNVVNGSAPATAFALVLTEELTVVESIAISAIQIGAAGIAEPQYLYYQLFTRIGEDVSNVSFDANEPGLGRIDKLHVSPPHSAGIIKRCIAKAEGKPIYIYADLYQDISAATAIVDGRRVSLLTDDGPGSAKDKPLVLVRPERRRALYNRPIKLLVSGHKVKQFVAGEMLYTDGIVISGDTCRCIRPGDDDDTRTYPLSKAFFKFLDE